MKRNNHKNINATLDDAIADIRHEEIDPEIVSGAAERVWSRLAASERADSVMAPAQLAATAGEATPAERIESCADFQTLIPAYMRKELSPARTLLVEDHVQECILCRKRLKESRSQKQAASIISAMPISIRRKADSSHRAVWRWGIAAALVIGFGLALMTASRRILPFGEAFHATVHAANGPVHRVTDAASSPVKVGDEILAGEKIRAGKDADAVIRLADGSLIEMKERSEFSVSDTARGVTVNLERGSIIIEAVKHRARPLYVATDDCLVTVTGTIFSVNSGTKGSRVSVVEGEVHVARGGDEQVLRSGDQTTTSPSLERVPLQEEIAWSRDAARYVRLAGELTALRRELDERMPRPGVRYVSRLAEMVPDDTVLYAALPNMGASLSESYRIMQERINQNAALREWWASEHRSDSVHNEAELKRIFESVRRFGEHLGDEIVISAAINSEGRPESPLVLAELRKPESFRAFLEDQVKTLAAEAKDAPSLRFVDDPSAVAKESAGKSAKSEIFVWINNDIFAAATNTRQLQQLAATMRDRGANRFAANSFHARITDIYREGAGIVVAADLEKIVAHALKDETRAGGGNDSPRQIEALRQLGLLDLKHFIVEQKEVEGKTRSSAMLTFNERARGVASWLAAPGPMGALDFISPDANVVAAFVVKEPASLVGDLLSFIETAVPDVHRHLAEIEARHGVDVRRDLAAPLGGEFAFAIDGPVLPTPSWKIIFEVYDPARLQEALERAVAGVNREATRQGLKGLEWERTESGGRTYYLLKSIDAGLEFHYTYANGYMIAAASRALVGRAVRYHESGYTLSRSARFTSTLPADGNANFSALFYHDLAPVLDPLARRMGEGKGDQSSEGQKALQALKGAALSPSLAYAYAQGDRIIFATDSREGGPFGLSPASLFGLPGSFGIQHMLHEGLQSGNSSPR